MANQSGSVSFQRFLESALLQYEKKTGVTLSKHPLALQLQSCNSVEDFNYLLQDKAKDVRESERITKSMKTIVSILTPLSSVASLPDTVGLVRYRALMAASNSDLFYRRFHLRKPYRPVLVSYSMYVPFSGLFVDFFVTPSEPSWQRAKYPTSTHLLAGSSRSKTSSVVSVYIQTNLFRPQWSR